MALTLSSGLTPEECLNLAADLIEQDEFRRRLSKCKEAVSSGEDLCNTLLENGVFSGVYARMASIGSVSYTHLLLRVITLINIAIRIASTTDAHATAIFFVLPFFWPSSFDFFSFFAAVTLAECSSL